MKNYKVVNQGDGYNVSSQGGLRHDYTVTTKPWWCDCEEFKLRECSHIKAVKRSRL